MDSIPPQYPQYNPPPEPKTSWISHHKILGAVFLLAVATAAVAGYYYWDTTRNIPATIDLPVHKEWKTYSNPIIGFELKHQNNISIRDGAVSSIDPKNVIAVVDIYKVPQGSDRDGVIFFLNDSLAKVLEEFKDMNVIDVVLNKNTWKKIENNKDSRVTYLIEREGKTIRAESASNIDLSKILLTVKFISTTVNSFNSCIAAGYPMMESYPAKCATPDGTTYVQVLNPCIQVIQPAKNPQTGEVRLFATPCDVPEGWEKVEPPIETQ